jgi:hypothetical protein
MATQQIVPILVGLLIVLLVVAWRVIRRTGERRPIGLKTVPGQRVWTVVASLVLVVIYAGVWIGRNR